MVCSSISEIAAADGTSESRSSRSLRLAPLAADPVEVILGGRADQRVMLERLDRPLSVRWRSSGVSWVTRRWRETTRNTSSG